MEVGNPNGIPSYSPALRLGRYAGETVPQPPNPNGVGSTIECQVNGHIGFGINPKRNVRPIPDRVCAETLDIRLERIVFDDAVPDWRCNGRFVPKQKG